MRVFFGRRCKNRYCLDNAPQIERADNSPTKQPPQPSPHPRIAHKVRQLLALQGSNSLKSVLSYETKR
jgi:hypothetical protein